jgi:acetyl esterase/lipase
MQGKSASSHRVSSIPLGNLLKDHDDLEVNTVRKGMKSARWAVLIGLVGLLLSIWWIWRPWIDSVAVRGSNSTSLQLANKSTTRTDAERVPRSLGEWRALIASVNLESATWRDAVLKSYPARITPGYIKGVHVFFIAPDTLSNANRTRVLLHLHGGAYVFFGGTYAVTEGVLLAHYAKTNVISIDYRMAPDHPFPAALDDVVKVWEDLSQSVKGSHIGVFGSSAGGGLTLATVLRLKQLHLPLPGAIAPGSPWSDLTKTGDTYFTNDHIDTVAVQYAGLLESCAVLYAGRHYLKNPLLSPVYGDYTGFPPAILTSGTRDLFLSNTVRVYRKLRDASVDARLNIYEGQSHTGYLVIGGPDTGSAMTEIATFFDEHLAR